MRFIKTIIILSAIIISSCTNDDGKKNESTTKSDYKLVWQDEFSVDGKPDPTKWGYEIGHVRGKEEQYYTDSLKNTRIENGFLIIEALKEKIKNDAFTSFDDKNWMTNKDSAKYTSGSITTKGLVEWKYGKIDVRAKLAGGRGIWPAIWMLGENWPDKEDWPKCGEIDIMEYVGYDRDEIHGTVHTQAFNHVLKTQVGKVYPLIKPYEDFHIYSINWTPEKIEILVDGNIYNTFNNQHKTIDEWPFDQKFHLKLNVAVGGGWGGLKGVNDSIFPQKMLVDFVRVYQKQ